MRKLVLVSSLVFAALFAACGSAPNQAADSNPPPPLEPKVSAYVRVWGLGLGEEQENSVYWTADQIHAEYLTDLILAFGTINQDDKSTIEIEPGFKDLWEQVAALKQKFPTLRVTISIGGAGAEFSDTAHNPALRAKLVANARDLLEQHDLDGIDVDWEFPVGPPDWKLDIKTRSQDKANFISLLKELRAAMDALGEKTGKRYGLSAAASPMPWYFQRNDIKQAIKILDTLKIMAYDYYGTWSSTTGHNANLYTSPGDPAWGGISTNWSIEQYLKAGFPASKLMVGVAFYGHAWQGVKTAGERNGLFQPYDKKNPSPFDGAGWDKIKPLLEPGSGYTRYWDDVAKSPYVYNGDTFISYTDQEALGYIADYAKEKGLGGVFAWEYAHDMDGDLLKTLFEKSQ